MPIAVNDMTKQFLSSRWNQAIKRWTWFHTTVSYGNDQKLRIWEVQFVCLKRSLNDGTIAHWQNSNTQVIACVRSSWSFSTHGILTFPAVALEVCISQAFSCDRSHLVCCSRQVLAECKLFQIKPWSLHRKHEVQTDSICFNSKTVIANRFLSLWNSVQHLDIISRSLGWHKSEHPPMPTCVSICSNTSSHCSATKAFHICWWSSKILMAKVPCFFSFCLGFSDCPFSDFW